MVGFGCWLWNNKEKQSVGNKKEKNTKKRKCCEKIMREKLVLKPFQLAHTVTLLNYTWHIACDPMCPYIYFSSKMSLYIQARWIKSYSIKSSLKFTITNT